LSRSATRGWPAYCNEPTRSSWRSEEEYTALHLLGAVNIPLKLLDADTTAGLDRGRPVVVYCWDSL
jgi:rhodanese-related sulfurtransferase